MEKLIYHKPDFIDRTSNSTKHVVWLFIKMIDDIQARYSEKFHDICKYVLEMSELDILNLKFTQSQFERLRDIYLLNPEEFSLSREVIGDQWPTDDELLTIE